MRGGGECKLLGCVMEMVEASGAPWTFQLHLRHVSLSLRNCTSRLSSVNLANE